MSYRSSGLQKKLLYLSAKINNKTAPNNAVQPNVRAHNDGTECKKKKVITNTKVTPDFTNRTLFLIGY